ncbi:MAG: hypothetical protein QXM56_02045 [Acidilobaceae archaeon]
MSTTWTRLPLTHIILETIKKLAGDDGVILESTLKSYLFEKEKIEISPTDLTRSLMILEKENYIVVQLSTKDERIIKLKTSKRG